MSTRKKLRALGSKIRALTPDKRSPNAQPSQEANGRTSIFEHPRQQVTDAGFFPGAHDVAINSDMFKNAHNFVINNSITTEMIAANAQRGMRRLFIEHVMLDALPDSSARYPPPLCHPNTRTTLLGKFQEWISDQAKERRLLWLNGPAGVGKTAVLQTIAELQDLRSAAVFLSRPYMRNDPSRVIPTIAYQIAVREPAYQLYVQEELGRDPLLFQKHITVQFQALITEPIVKGGLLKEEGDLIILLDGLDECNDEEAQGGIVHLIADFITEHPSAPLSWIISSRPEEHLRGALSSLDVEPCVLELQLSMDGEEAHEDIRRYFVAGFGDICQRYGEVIPPSWPTDADLEKITNAASGWFLFAVTLLRFVGDPQYANPVPQFHSVVSAIDGIPQSGSRDPFAVCDIMYSQALSQVPVDLLPIVQILLGHLILRDAFLSTTLSLFGYSLYSTSNILGLREVEVYGALRKLRSVLHVPLPDSAHKENIRFLHTSFSTFLRYSERSRQYSIDLPRINTKIWNRYSRILHEVNNNSNPRFRMAPQLAIALSSPLKGSQYERRRFTSGLLYEAQFHWAHFLIPDCPCTSLPNSDPLGITLLTDQDRLDTLRTVNFKILVTGYFVEGSDHIGPFFTYLCDLWQSSRKELEKDGFIKELSLEGLAITSIDTATLATKDHAICIERKSEKETAKANHSWYTREMLMDALVKEVDLLQRESPHTRVLVCGSEPGKQGVLIIYDSCDGQEPAVVYYYLPLVDSFST